MQVHSEADMLVLCSLVHCADDPIVASRRCKGELCKPGLHAQLERQRLQGGRDEVIRGPTVIKLDMPHLKLVLT